MHEMSPLTKGTTENILALFLTCEVSVKRLYFMKQNRSSPDPNLLAHRSWTLAPRTEKYTFVV